MKLSEWAKKTGLSYKTAWRMWKSGRLPVRAEQLPTGTVLVFPDEEKTITVALYARVASNEHMADLDRQIAKLSSYAAEKQWLVAEVVKEIGFGFNGHCRYILKLLMNKEIHVILVENRDRVARFGYEYIETILSSQGRQLVVVDEAANSVDFREEMREMVSIICEKIYGKPCTAEKSFKILSELLADREEKL